jgi:hypothetical protein
MGTRDEKVRNYSASEIQMTFGVKTLTGLAPDTFVTVEPRGDAFTTQKGADGSINRSNMNEFSYIITANFSQASPSNDILSGILNGDKVTNAGVLPFILNDLLGSTLVTAPVTWIAREATTEEGAELGIRTWVFHTGVSVNFVGGNKGIDGEV